MRDRREVNLEGLRGGEIHVWLAYVDRLQELGASQAHFLSSDERERVARFRSGRDGARFGASHAILRLLLAAYTGVDPRSIMFRRSASGRPSLANGSLRFSLSRSAEIALFAFAADRDIGVDIERIDPSAVTERTISAVFALNGRAALAGTRPDKRAERFFRIWTRTEAWLKAHGEGIGRFSEARDAATGTVARAARLDSARWTLDCLPAPPGYAAAIAYQGARHPLRLRLVRPPVPFVL